MLFDGIIVLRDYGITGVKDNITYCTTKQLTLHHCKMLTAGNVLVIVHNDIERWLYSNSMCERTMILYEDEVLCRGLQQK